ncbi:MAG TPA: YihY/virulence factor BrkB family protein [Xanthobacteraceae bacterium]|nr:YihY/virulence factor BrkB family protein [Xanthobacteraceae bacterium]
MSGGRTYTALWIATLAAVLMAIGLTPRRQPRQPASPSSGSHDPSAIAAEADRGRGADRPAEIPPRGWKDIALRIWGNIGSHRIVLVAAGVTFYALLAIFPAIAALVALYGLFADPSRIAAQVDDLSGLLPGGALDVVRDQMTRVAAQGQSKLGLALVIGLAVSLWSANAGVKSLFDALNLVHDEPERRGLVRLNLVSLGVTSAALLFVLIAIGCIVALPAIFATTNPTGATHLIVQIARWPVLFVVIAFGLSCIYRFGPSRATPRWRWVTWGSAFAAVAWIAVSLAFSWYTANFGTYNKTYGSLGAVVGFMMWIWLSTCVILIGAELDAEMEHQTARDTTSGGDKPIGARGAKMADTVGAAQG